MSDRVIDDDLIRGRSSDVLRRLVSHLKPYPLSVVLTILALVLATGAELLSPLVMRRALDDHILRSEVRLTTDEALRAGVTLPGDAVQIGDYSYVRDSDLVDLGSEGREEARQEGWLDGDEWYVFPADSPGDAAIIAADPDSFESAADGRVPAVRLR